jgi:predicted O-methyltransferase YrrM
MNRWNMLKPKLLKQILPRPVKAEQVEVSMVSSMHDEPAVPTPWLLDVCLHAAEAARIADLGDVSQRITDGPDYPGIWPGEHYKLLAGFVKHLKPKVVIEIGTFRGIGTLALAKYLPETGMIATFDPVSWNQVATTALRDSDFGDRFIQFNDDLADMRAVEKHKSLLKSADLFFIDAAKDGVMERHFVRNLKSIGLKPNAVVLFDDIRLWNMLDIWRCIDFPKLDLTSFGHWSGTGVVQWNPT